MRKLFAVNTPPSDDFNSPGWLAARARLELYLEASDLAKAEAQRLLETALQEARAADPAMPVAAAMATLQRLLAAREAQSPPRATPALHRASMAPERIDRSPLRFLISELLRPMLAGSARLAHAQRHRLMLVCVSGVIGLMLTQLH
jgi:hypothetical protein